MPRANPRLFVIGLTGNIATGKSAVSGMLARLGATVIDADEVAHQVMERGTAVWQSIVDEFGDAILDRQGHISRPRLGARVFSDPAALARLEAIVHPAVLAVVGDRLQELGRQGAGRRRVVVVEAIKLLEAGMRSRCDELWVVTAPREQQVERLQRTRGMTREQADLRIDAQPPQAEKAAVADVVIANDATIGDLEARVAREWQRIQALL